MLCAWTNRSNDSHALSCPVINFATIHQFCLSKIPASRWLTPDPFNYRMPFVHGVVHREGSAGRSASPISAIIYSHSTSMAAKGTMSESQDVPAVSSQATAVSSQAIPVSSEAITALSQAIKPEPEDSKEVYINLNVKQQVRSFPVTFFFLL